jgi:hypothetical protein
MNEYNVTEPETCPECGSANTEYLDEQATWRNTVHFWTVCHDCDYQWLEIVKFDFELRFKQKGDNHE